MGKDQEIFGLMKIPDEILLKQTLVENGKLKAYIQELEYNLSLKKEKVKEVELSIEEKRNIRINLRKDEAWKSIKSQNGSLIKKNKELIKKNKELINTIIKLSK
jgi:hypothetical protein